MNEYEKKQEARRERYQELAKKASTKSLDAYGRAGKATKHIPIGQPILAGHYSEKKHRNAMKRSDVAMRRSIEENKKAAYYAGKADSVGTGGISSDDPDAIIKLKDKLAKLTSKRNTMKAVNVAWRNYVKNPESLKQSKLSDELQKLVVEHKPSWSGERGPFHGWPLTNLGATIRQTEKRIAKLEALKV